jgi:pilus assembly protein Flp/PilA
VNDKSLDETRNETKMRDIDPNFLICALRRFARQDRGATAIEYALIAGGISIVILVAVTSVGTTMNALYYDKLLSMF